jgi:FkbM family methyltransferase
MLRSKIRTLSRKLYLVDSFRDTYFGLAIARLFGVKAALNYQIRLKNFKDLFDSLQVSLIFDVGANIGDTSSIYVAAGCKVIAVEPDPKNLQRLASRFRFNNDVIVVPYGVGASLSVLRLHCYDSTAAHDTFSEKRKRQLEDLRSPALGVPITPSEEREISLITLDMLILQYGIPDYIKVDVEGFELEVLRGLSHPVRAISFECILPTFLEESIECLNRLGELSSLYRYNFWSAKHDYSLQSPCWLSQGQMLRLLRSESLSFMEIIAIASPDQHNDIN